MSDVGTTLSDVMTRATAAHLEGHLVEAEQLYSSIVHAFPEHVDALFSRGSARLSLGRWNDALSDYDKLLEVVGAHTEAYGNRGIALSQLGRSGEALLSYSAAIALTPDFFSAHFGKGVIFQIGARPSEALTSFGRVLAIVPRHPEALNNRGLAFLDLQRPVEALECFDLATSILPDHVDALSNRSGALRALGRLDPALASLRAVLAIRPDHPGAKIDLGAILREMGELPSAIVHHRRVLCVHPRDVVARIELGNSLRLDGRIADAISYYRQSLAIEPNDAGALGNLGYAMLARADPLAALAAARRALGVRFSSEVVSLVVKCLEEPIPVPVNTRSLVLRLSAERWERPSSLASVGWHLVRSSEAMARALGAASPADSLRLISGDILLRTLLVLSPVTGSDIERLLTKLRRYMLDLVVTETIPEEAGESLGFFCALAQQCFLNEYVFALAGDESEMAARVRDSLVSAAGAAAPISPLSVVAVAAYFPLYLVPGIDGLFRQSWPSNLEALLTQQVRQPSAEISEIASITAMTPIAAEVSRSVRQQYEENPYPRWTDTIAPRPPVAVDDYLRQAFPRASFRGPAEMDKAEVLIAGCGTGQQSVETAMTFKHSSVLAIDLSLASLCYARRKSRELGAPPIEYAQADIMELGRLGRRFDLIEASGVLHHLADPFAGWRVLLSLLKLGGVMRLGLYSRAARRDIVSARAFIEERKYRASPEDIRNFRRDLLRLGELPWVRSVVESGEFSTVSACRDLLFHVQEHRLSLPEIADFLSEQMLRFIGFEMRLTTRAAYAARFPDDLAMSDLRSWHAFETENPDTFRGMYQFWVQKPL